MIRVHEREFCRACCQTRDACSKDGKIRKGKPKKIMNGVRMSVGKTHDYFALIWMNSLKKIELQNSCDMSFNATKFCALRFSECFGS